MAGNQDWACPNTGCVNHTRLVFGSKATCPQCGASKASGGGRGGGMDFSSFAGFAQAMVAMSGQGGMDGDWQCIWEACFLPIVCNSEDRLWELVQESGIQAAQRWV
ncbi:unnamed protein product [Symbiodinium microadriaticum]|nr:unnamed protein product [Symbiodinium microadriaticum]